MPLKRLELFNFKSYKGTQVIDFGESPFICIIGPNGAGKSNLMDAISFVLGVKSAQLRSTQLKDLVYRGRKALQAEGEEGMDVDETQETAEDVDARTAWVMAVYEDEKGREWRFRRSISTAGQSTYYLNQREVAWKNYNQQLEKFNILVKAKNFLVFQGDVEGVASQDSKALAKLIDRISGSLDYAQAYEAAKAEQDKATEASTTNYAKKRGMLSEVKHFKEQRDEVRQWERLRDSRDAMVQRHLLWRLFHLTNEITESTRKVEEANERLSDLRGTVAEDESALRNAKKEQAQAQLNARKREVNLKKAEKAYEDKKPELVAVETQIEHSAKKARNAAHLLERVQKDEERQAESVKTLAKGKADIEKRMQEAAERQRQKSRSAGRVLTPAQLKQYRDLRSQANLLAVSERQQVETLRRQQKTEGDAVAAVEDRLQQAERQKAKLASETTNLEEREEARSARVEEMNDEKESIKAQLDRAAAERTRISMKETEINEKLQDTYIKLLQAGVDKRESEREVKLRDAITNLKRIFPGVHGRVVELCRPTTRRYETAVMTVLGRNIDAVVVEHEKTAIDCIEYMRSQRVGQATFIPLDTIQVKPVSERLRNFAKGARLAIDCIEYNSAVERAMQHACGNSMVCDTMDVARYICYEKGQEVKAVTLEGTVIHKSGLITGGTSSSGGRKFSDNDVQGLQRMKEGYLQQLQDLVRSKPKDKADEGLLESLARLEAELSVANDDLSATRLRLEGLRKELASVDREIEKLTPDLEKKRRAAKSTADKLDGLLNTISAADNTIFGDFCRQIGVADIREYEDVQLKMAKEESEALEAFATQQARVSHQIEFETAQLQNTRERAAQLQASISKEEHNAESLQITREKLEEELETLQSEIERQRRKLEDAKSKLEEVNQAVDQARDAARRTQRSLDKALKEIASCNDEIERSSSDRYAIYRRCRLEEIDLPLLSGSLDAIPIEEAVQQESDQMDIDDDGTLQPAKTKDYGVEPDFDELEEDDKENGSEEVGREFETQIAKMKADLERIAPNMKAVDRLADVQGALDDAEREAEATRQDSKTARDKFQEIRKKRVDLFQRAYEHMSGCIDQIYKDLTKTSNEAGAATGGVAFLSLEEPDEPYLGGVKYNVMPPGKRWVEMEQLSGGEKTMAALALLFAIHR
ncbi:hypothetical protein BCR39DRAFT_538898 [Naematelia encephala]|uniref:SMC hinge domain-containing protein n=1 Tax=Naematelia encephala TaxID=71784 RepID=A0A1Y2AY24_9TREE|nr:hypothetical protein BCR39DRAFT_538898 [Naematelia encephala]